MASLDLDLIRHALSVAEQHGFSEVELGLEGSLFRAKLEQNKAKSQRLGDTHAPATATAPADAGLEVIRSPYVGFYSVGPKPLEVGGMISGKDVVAVVRALGIGNDVEAGVSGEIVEVLVKEGQAVEYGQVLAKVKA